MKTVSKILFSVFLILFTVSCGDADNNIDYVKPVSITFDGVGSTNIVQLASGVDTFDLKINVTSTKGILSFSVYEANPLTGVAIKLIRPKTTFIQPVSTYAFDSIIGGLTANRAIQVVIEDKDLVSYSKNMVLKITPAVIVSDIKIIETAEVYYGPYYASWYSGRCYMRLSGAPYSNEIDFSLGNTNIFGKDTINISVPADTIVKISGKDTTTTYTPLHNAPIPAFISSSLRQSRGLLYLPNLRSCTFALTTLTKAAFDAIPLIDGSTINNLVSPTLTEIKAEVGKVYLYENNTEKGLIYVSVLQGKAATIEQSDGTWETFKNTTKIVRGANPSTTLTAIPNYHELKIQTKIIKK